MGVARRLVVCAALLLGAADPARAGWFQDTVTATLAAKADLTVATPFGPAAPVRGGTTFLGRVERAGTGHGFDVALDVGPYEIAIRFAASDDHRLVDPAGLLDITLTGLSPAGRILLVGFSCPPPEGFCQGPGNPPDVTLTDTLPTALVLGFSALQGGASYVYAIPIPNEVPAPGAWLLMATGLAGLVAGSLRRRRLQRSPSDLGRARPRAREAPRDGAAAWRHARVVRSMPSGVVDPHRRVDAGRQRQGDLLEQ
jgi:hypothetical protein